MIRVVLVDDQVVARAGPHVLLEEHGNIIVVGEAAGGREAVAMVACRHPDMVYMDLRAPAGDGSTIARQIVTSRQDGNPVVLVVTTFDLDADVFGALKAGADGFILRDCEPEGLVNAVRRLAAGYGLVDHTVIRRVVAELVHRHVSAGNITETRKLMARELEIVKLLAADMSNTRIATELVVEISIVESHLTRILPKIGARDRMQVVVWAHRSGLVGWPICLETG